jgi:hypothetical protein
MATTTEARRQAIFARIDEVHSRMVSLKRVSKGVMETRDGRYRLTLHNTLNRGARHGVYYWDVQETTIGPDGYKRHATVSSLDDARKIFGMGVDVFDSAACARLVNFA